MKNYLAPPERKMLLYSLDIKHIMEIVLIGANQCNLVARARRPLLINSW